jgi:hypothetical protein
MQSILEEFFYGNITPANQTFKHNSEYERAVKALTNKGEKLLEKLNAEERTLFEKYLDTQGEVDILTAVQNFIHGYKLGVLMTSEAFVTGGELIAG